MLVISVLSLLRNLTVTRKEEALSLRKVSLLTFTRQSLRLTIMYVDHSVAATKTPIIFIGTGEHLHDLEKFTPKPFISKMLGMGDMQGLVERAQEMAMANPERQESMMKKLEKGEFTVRDLKDQLQTIMGM